MKRFLLGLAVVTCAALLFWLLRSTQADGALAIDPGVETPQAATDSSRVAGDVADVSWASKSPPEERTPAAAAPAPSETEARPAPRVVVDRNARDWVHLIVQDRQGAPIANADIRMTGLRTKREASAHWGWPEEPSIGRTAKDGTAKLWFPVWTNPDDETGELTFTVSHPDFVSKTVDEFMIGPAPRVVVLDQGAFVVVSGWISSPDEVITDIEPHLTDDVRLAKGAWQPIRDGRLSTANIPVGEHAIYLRHDRAKEGLLFSRVTPFTLAEGEQKHLHLELVAAMRLDGRLEDEVPRPVKDGTARLNLSVGTNPADRAKMQRSFTAPINADGTFVFADVPPGDGQIIGLCDGWSSERVASDVTLDGVPTSSMSAEESMVLAYRSQPSAQHIDPSAEGVFVLKMEPTASLKAVFRGPDGAPAPGVVLDCWPNVRWRNGYSTMFLDRPWSATSDTRGEALVTNLPSGRLMYGIVAGDLDFPLENGERYRGAALEAGKTLEVAFDLEARKE